MTGDRILCAETVLHIDEHVFMLIDDYEGGLPPLPHANGLFGVHPGVAAVATGIATGPVNIAVELLDGPPTEELDSAWEAVAEEPFEVLGGELFIGSLETGPEPGGMTRSMRTVRSPEVGCFRPGRCLCGCVPEYVEVSGCCCTSLLYSPRFPAAPRTSAQLESLL